MESRDLNKIIDRFGHENAQTQALDQIEGRWGKEAIVEWDFGDLPQEITTRQAGVKIRMYPYLQDKHSDVDLLASTDRLYAQNHHLNGLARLILFQIKPTVDHIASELVMFNKSALLFAPIGKKVDLLDDFLIALVKRHFLQGQLPTNRNEFVKLCDSSRHDLFDMAMEFDQMVFKTISGYHECMKKTKGKINISLAGPLSDLKQQLSHLVYPSFLTHTPWEWLMEFPRYFEAGLIRIEKMPRELAKERQFLLFFEPVWDKFVNLNEKYQKHGVESQDLLLFRWMLEEFRVSYFAQQLGTKMTISEKRFRKTMG